MNFPDKGIDVILDPVGASHAADNMEMIAMDGRFVFCCLRVGVCCQMLIADASC